MRFQRIIIAVSVLNALASVFIIAQTRAAAVADVAPIIRARIIELVDENGKARAQLNVETNGEAVFRLRDRNGTIRGKFGAGEDGSGLSMMDDRTEATVQIRANKTGSGITVFDRDGQKREVK